MIIEGKKISQEILENLKGEIISKKLKLRLAAILVGSDPEFKKFVELKGRAAESMGIIFKMYQFSENISTEELREKVREICNKNEGVLVELPLPKHIDSKIILNEVPVKKDVDVLSDKAQAEFYRGRSKVFPPAVEAVKTIFNQYNINPKAKKVAVFGYGILVGKPISSWLERSGAEVSLIRSNTENPTGFSREADIIISGVGKPGLITRDMVKDGVIVIDFGYGNKNGKMVGDVEFDAILPKALLITPVPGGMGPILIAAVLKNLLKLNESKSPFGWSRSGKIGERRSHSEILEPFVKA